MPLCKSQCTVAMYTGTLILHILKPFVMGWDSNCVKGLKIIFNFITIVSLSRAFFMMLLYQVLWLDWKLLPLKQSVIKFASTFALNFSTISYVWSHQGSNCWRSIYASAHMLVYSNTAETFTCVFVPHVVINCKHCTVS